MVSEVKQFRDAGYNPENKEWYVPVSIATLPSIKMWLKDRGFTEGIAYFPSKRVLEYEPPEEILVKVRLTASHSCIPLNHSAMINAKVSAR